MRLKTIMFLIVALVLTSIQGFAYDKEELSVKEAVENLLQGPTVDAVTRTALPGLFEVIVENSTIYYMPSTGQFITGMLFSKNGENLSKRSLERLASDKIDNMKTLLSQKDKAIKVGSGPVEVIEVSDPDCPYCRKMEEYWKTHQNEVTRYIFLMPIKALHPDAENKARYILASPDKAKALESVLSGKLDDDDSALKRAFNDKGQLKVLEEITGKAGVQATPTYLINGTVVYGADTDQIDELIKGGEATNKDTTI